MLPNHFAGLGPDRKARIRAGQCSARRTALSFRCRSGATRTVVDQIEFGIVGELAPYACHPTLLIWGAGPCFVTRLSRARDHLIAPKLPAGSGVMTRDITTVARKLARSARDDYAVSDNRASRVADLQVAATVGLPDHFPAPSAQRDDDIVPAYEIDLVAIDGNASLALPQSVAHRRGWRPRMAVLPQEVARRGVDRLYHVAGITQKHYAVVNEGRGLVDAGFHGARPDQLQIFHIGFVDLVERTVAPGLIIAPMDRPILGAGSPQCLVGHRNKILNGSYRFRWRLGRRRRGIRRWNPFEGRGGRRSRWLGRQQLVQIQGREIR